MAYIQRSTLASALYDHIREQEKREREMGYTGDSGHLAAVREFVQALRNNEHVEVRGEC